MNRIGPKARSPLACTRLPATFQAANQNRPTLGIPKEEVLRLSDRVGLHPQMAPLHELFKEGQVAVVQGVGYPQPDRSHFRSMEIWHTASTATMAPGTGWLGQAYFLGVGASRVASMGNS